MSDDWRVGDLAVYINRGGCGCHGPAPEKDLAPLGSIHPVVEVVAITCSARIGLNFATHRAHKRAFCAECFRKIRPDQHESCEPEFVTLLKRIKTPAYAGGEERK